jgi:hypothetical protein
VKADNVSPIPKKLSVEQAGVMPSDALTALRGLDEILKLKQGESLMVFGAWRWDRPFGRSTGQTHRGASVCRSPRVMMVWR